MPYLGQEQEVCVKIIAKRRPDASQRFPFIPLGKALERVRELYKIANGHEVPFPAALKAWGYAEKSSGGAQTAAALKAFGLLEDVSGAEVRRVKLTSAAAKITRDPREISPDRDLLIREAALKPPLFREIIEKYSGMPPSDEALKAFLIIDKSLKDEAIPEFIRSFAGTMSLAKISDHPIIHEIEEGYQENNDVHSAEVENTSEISPSTRAPQGSADAGQRTSLPILQRLDLLETAPSTGLRREVITLDEGDVVITFPDGLSPQSFGDLKDHLDLFIKKMQRRASAMAALTPDMKAKLIAAGIPAEKLESLSLDQIGALGALADD
jgi:hypothetical protein